MGKFLSNGEVVFEFFFRDVQAALLEAHSLIGKLLEHSSSWLVKLERERLVGRPVYYREVPAVITRIILDQGCVIIRTADGQPFPPPVYRDTDEDDEREVEVKTEVLDPNIWWHRDIKANAA